MKIVLIRHAEPDYEHNTLTEKGFLEAKALGECYSAKDFDYIYSSSLPRARMTAEAVIKGEKPIIVKDEFVEFHHPLTIDENGTKWNNWDLMPSFIEKNKDELFDLDNYLDGPIMQTAEMKKYHDIVINEFDNILAGIGYVREGLNYKVTRPNNETLVIFAHHGLNSVLMAHLIQVPYWLVAQYFCALTSSVTTFVSEEREDGIAQFRCLGFSDVSHLEHAGLKPSFMARFRETRFSNDRK